MKIYSSREKWEFRGDGWMLRHKNFLFILQKFWSSTSRDLQMWPTANIEKFHVWFMWLGINLGLRTNSSVGGAMKVVKVSLDANLCTFCLKSPFSLSSSPPITKFWLCFHLAIFSECEFVFISIRPFRSKGFFSSAKGFYEEFIFIHGWLFMLPAHNFVPFNACARYTFGCVDSFFGDKMADTKVYCYLMLMGFISVNRNHVWASFDRRTILQRTKKNKMENFTNLNSGLG